MLSNKLALDLSHLCLTQTFQWQIVDLVIQLSKLGNAFLLHIMVMLGLGVHVQVWSQDQKIVEKREIVYMVD